VEFFLRQTIRRPTQITLAALGFSGLRLERRSNCSLIPSTLSSAAIPFRYNHIFNIATFDNNSFFNFFKVYDGNSKVSNLLLSHRGSSIPATIISTANLMLVSFYTDYSIVYSGFSARFQALNLTSPIDSTLEPGTTTVLTTTKEPVTSPAPTITQRTTTQRTTTQRATTQRTTTSRPTRTTRPRN
jgi:CUB domain